MIFQNPTFVLEFENGTGYFPKSGIFKQKKKKLRPFRMGSYEDKRPRGVPSRNMRNDISSLYGLNGEIRPKWTSKMDPAELFIHLVGATGKRIGGWGG